MDRKSRDRFNRTLLRWYRKEGRNLPWRRTRDPYRILISEIMLQQTQVSRVLTKYRLFLKEFPDFRSLAHASRSHVIMAWRGMGYNNRAVRLHNLAKEVVHSQGERLSDRFDDLIRLPGIGRYTANALLSFAHRQPVPVVETNVRRVLSRILSPMRRVTDVADEETVWTHAGELLPRRNGPEWNQALMDLGALICTPRSPSCGKCPVGFLCASSGAMLRPVNSMPRREPSFLGIPNRIHRGRVIEILRDRESATGMAFNALGRRLHDGFARGHADWLTTLLGGLERDGLLRITRRSAVITRVQLA